MKKRYVKLSEKIPSSIYHRALSLIFQGVVFILLAYTGKIEYVQIVAGYSMVLNASIIFERGYYSSLLSKININKKKSKEINYSSMLLTYKSFYYYIFFSSILYASINIHIHGAGNALGNILLIASMALNFVTMYGVNNVIYTLDSTKELSLINKSRGVIEIVFVVFALILSIFASRENLFFLLYLLRSIANVVLLILVKKNFNSKKLNGKINAARKDIGISSISSGIFGYYISFLLSGFVSSDLSTGGLYYQVSAVFSGIFSSVLYGLINSENLSRRRVFGRIYKIFLLSLVLSMVVILILEAINVKKDIKIMDFGFANYLALSILAIISAFMPSFMAFARSYSNFEDKSSFYIFFNIFVGVLIQVAGINFIYAVYMWSFIYVIYALKVVWDLEMSNK